jgi:hypothetical protein
MPTDRVLNDHDAYKCCSIRHSSVRDRPQGSFYNPESEYPKTEYIEVQCSAMIGRFCRNYYDECRDSRRACNRTIW